MRRHFVLLCEKWTVGRIFYINNSIFFFFFLKERFMNVAVRGM